jgi:hypothetical protein
MSAYALLCICVAVALAACVAVSAHDKEIKGDRGKKWVAVATRIIRLHGGEERSVTAP